MSLSTSVAIFFLIWWVALFAVLPWAVRSQEETGHIIPGTDPGAPSLPGLRAKLIWTTVVAIVAFSAFDIVYSYRLVEIEKIATLFGFPELSSGQPLPSEAARR
jgi:predicted secreted protein